MDRNVELALSGDGRSAVSWAGDDGRVAVGDVHVARLLELVHVGFNRVPDDLNARRRAGIERRIVRTPHRTARDLEHYRPAVCHSLAGLGISPRSVTRQRAIL